MTGDEVIALFREKSAYIRTDFEFVGVGFSPAQPLVVKADYRRKRDGAPSYAAFDMREAKGQTTAEVAERIDARITMACDHETVEMLLCRASR